MNGPIVVTGASGNIGSAAVHALAHAGVEVRAAGTDPEALARRFPGVPAVRLDLHDPTTFPAALDRVSGLLLVRPPAIARVAATLNALLDEAQRRGVAHVVFSSVTGADTNALVPHHRVETHLQRSDLSWTILRPGFFAQNLADAYRHDILQEHRIVLPAGDGRAAFVDTRDVGELAAAILADPSPHRGAGYVLTGSQALGFAEVAEILACELGRAVVCAPSSAPAYLRRLRRQGLPLTQALVQTVLHTGLRQGQADQVDPTLGRLLGRPPRTVAQYVRDHRHLWAAVEAVR